MANMDTAEIMRERRQNAAVADAVAEAVAPYREALEQLRANLSRNFYGVENIGHGSIRNGIVLASAGREDWATMVKIDPDVLIACMDALRPEGT